MDTDLIQLGSFSFSKTILDVLAPLFGTIIGGAIAYLATMKIESVRWQKGRKDKYDEQVREALGMALEWLDPLDSALSEIDLLISGYLMNSITFGEFQKSYPNLVMRLGKLDPPRRLQALLPDGVYSKSWHFIRRSQDLQMEITADKVFHTIRADNWNDKFKYYSDFINEIRVELKEYESFLINEYRKTFGV